MDQGMTFAAKVRRAREIYALRQKERVFKTTFAAAMGIPIDTLNDLESGRTVPPLWRQQMLIIMATRPDLSEQIAEVAKEWGIEK